MIVCMTNLRGVGRVYSLHLYIIKNHTEKRETYKLCRIYTVIIPIHNVYSIFFASLNYKIGMNENILYESQHTDIN